MRTAIIGGGFMGEALIAALRRREVAHPADIVVADVARDRRDHLHGRYGVAAVADPRAAALGADLVVLAVKPQQVEPVFRDLHEQLTPEQLALSIMAGVPLGRLTTGLAHPAVVRVMPNMLAEVGEAMSVWIASPSVNEEQRGWTRALLSAAGHQWEVTEEKYLDLATAVSGSGPAYFFLVIEALIDAGVHIGLPRDMATELAVQTAAGSALLMRETKRHPAALRNAVTSPGGTTAEALLVLESSGLRAAFVEAVIAAYEKAQSLG